jgi:hypothetical protein
MNNRNYSHFIWQHYGPIVSRNVWDWGGSLIKLNKIKHDLIFLRNCKKENMIPMFLRFHVSPTHAVYKNAIHRCYQQILLDGIKWKKRQLTNAYRLSINLQRAVEYDLNNLHYIQVQNIFTNLIEYKKMQWIESHEKK